MKNKDFVLAHFIPVMHGQTQFGEAGYGTGHGDNFHISSDKYGYAAGTFGWNGVHENFVSNGQTIELNKRRRFS